MFPFPYFTIISASLQLCSSEAVAQHLGRRDRAAASNEAIFWFHLKPIFQELGKSGAGGRAGGGGGRAGRRGRFYTESSQERGGRWATRRVELNQPWRCITLGWKVNRSTQNTSTKLETWPLNKSQSFGYVSTPVRDNLLKTSVEVLHWTTTTINRGMSGWR